MAASLTTASRCFMIQHVESASARLTKKPWFGGLLLGILGLSTAIFVVVYSPFFRALPSSESARLVRFWQVDGEDRFRDFSSQELDALVAASSSFDSIAGISFLLQTSHDDDGRSGTVTIGRISPGFFEVFRVEPVLGRAFTSEELRNGAPVVILGDRFWSDRYNGDPDVLGRRVTMHGREYTVIGVMPAEMRTPSRSSLWRPFQANETASHNQMIVIGRLAADIPIERAAAEVQAIAHIETADGVHAVWIQPLREARARHAWHSVLLLSSVVLVLVFTACVTVTRSKTSVVTSLTVEE